MFFKILGVVLFFIEIAWFIALPIYREIREWWKMRIEIVKSRRFPLVATVLCFGVAVFLVPWSGTVRVQGVLMADLETVIFPPRPTRIASINVANGQFVSAGQQLAAFACRISSTKLHSCCGRLH